MRLSRRSSLREVAIVVGDALRRHRIRAVLTGGACASLHSGGAHESVDVDFILSGVVKQTELDRAMLSVGFARHRDRYVHERVAFFVEFPRGPLAIGEDVAVRPVVHRVGALRALILSATDSCRDRLAAFYHWNDRQSLSVAVAIARRCRVNRQTIGRWSLREGMGERFEEFLAELGTRQRARTVAKGKRRRASPRRARA